MFFEDPMAAAEPVVVVLEVKHFLGDGSLRKQILFDITTEIAAGEVVTKPARVG
jgi:hypothetical protein